MNFSTENWRQLLCETSAAVVASELPHYSEVTDIGPKDSNFPQNAWGLLKGTAQDHFFGVKPGNSDA